MCWHDEISGYRALATLDRSKVRIVRLIVQRSKLEPNRNNNKVGCADCASGCADSTAANWIGDLAEPS